MEAALRNGGSLFFCVLRKYESREGSLGNEGKSMSGELTFAGKKAPQGSG